MFPTIVPPSLIHHLLKRVASLLGYAEQREVHRSCESFFSKDAPRSSTHLIALILDSLIHLGQHLSHFLVGLGLVWIMKSESLHWFLSSYVVLVIAIFFAAIDSLLISGFLGGLAVSFRSMAGTSSESKPAIYLIQEMPKWKWFSVIYLFILMTWLIKNMNSDYLNQINPLIATVTFMFPFIVPYALSEYKLYNQIKSKK